MALLPPILVFVVVLCGAIVVGLLRASRQLPSSVDGDGPPSRPTHPSPPPHLADPECVEPPQRRAA